MQTIFSQFTDFADADAAVRELQANGVEADSMNVVVHAQQAKSNLDDVNFARANVDSSDTLGEHSLTGLALLVANKRPVEVRGAGQVYAAGQMATILASSAVANSQSGDDMESVLTSYGVPAKTVTAYTNTVKQGGVLLWIRSDDQMVGTISSVLHSHNAKDVMTNQPT